MKIIKPEENILDRIGQTFELFKDNFLKLLIPIFLYTFLTINLFISIFTFFLIRYSKNLSETFLDKSNIENLSFLSYSPEIMIWILIWVILIILYVTFYIPFLLTTIKWIKQAYNWEEIKIKENIIYWFKNILKSFQTYWYIFAYIALIPAIIWIIWGFLAIYGLSYNEQNYILIWTVIIWLALFLFLIFSIYRWIKATFALYSAVDKEQYTKENFNNSLEITKNKWWRILWNIILTSIITWLFTWTIQKALNSLLPSSFDTSGIWLKEIMDAKETWNFEIEEIYKILDSYSPIANFINNSLNWILNTTITIFIMIFIYILYKRLEIENKTKNTEKIEL